MREENGAFYNTHPLVSFGFFMFAMLITMFYPHPRITAFTFLSALMLVLYIKGRRGLNILFGLLPLIAFVAILNPLISHQGLTILFFIGNTPITLEALIYGLVSGGMFASIILLFSCMNVYMTTDKFVYIFGGIAPSISLVIAMTLRFVPRFRERFQKIHSAQRAMGIAGHKNSVKAQIRDLFQVVSVMITWSLEGSIDTADSMSARGYSLRPKSRYSSYYFTRRDMILSVILTLLAGVAAVSFISGNIYTVYFPAVYMNPLSGAALLGEVAYVLFLNIPLLLQLKEDILWRLSISKT